MILKSHLWILPLLLAFFVSINFFWTKSLVPGFDTPFYLKEIRSFSRAIPNPSTYPYLDRFLTIAFPGLLSMIFNLDPIVSYRLAISLIYIAISYFLYRIFRQLTDNSWVAVLLSSSVIVSPFLINYSTMLFANFTGILWFITFFAVETGPLSKLKPLILGIIFGLIFYTHNFSSVSFGLIIITYYFIKLIFKPDKKVFRNGVGILMIAGIMSCLSLSKYINLKPVVSNPVQNVTKSSASVSFTPPVQVIRIGRETKLIRDAFWEYSGKYWVYYLFLFIPFALYLSRKHLIVYKQKFILPLSIFIPSFILSLQPFYHLNYLPERFVTLVGLSLTFFYTAIILLPPFKKYLILLAVMPLFLNYFYSDSLIINKGYRSYTEEEIQIYPKVKSSIVTDGVLLIASSHYYWSSYYLEGYTILQGDYFVSCGNISTPGYLGETNFTIARLLAETDTEKAIELISKLKSFMPDRKLYILGDSSLSCGKGTVLRRIDKVRLIFNQNSWALYEII